MAVILYKNWATFRRLRGRSNGMVSLTIIIRLTIFSFPVLLALMYILSDNHLQH